MCGGERALGKLMKGVELEGVMGEMCRRVQLEQIKMEEINLH